jgi:predicted  nucleic acid-binding Zn-ribbon protein
MKLEAAQRLLSAPSEQPAAIAKKAQKDRLNNEIENLNKQVVHLKDNMPSRQNRQSVSPRQQQTTQKQIHQTKEKIADLRLRKIQVDGK